MIDIVDFWGISDIILPKLPIGSFFEKMGKERKPEQPVEILDSLVEKAILKFRSKEAGEDGSVFDLRDAVIEVLRESGRPAIKLVELLTAQTSVHPGEVFDEEIKIEDHDSWEDLLFSIAATIVWEEVAKKDPQIKEEDEERIRKHLATSEGY